MRNEYANGLLIKPTIVAGGSVYSYDYTLSDSHMIGSNRA